MAAPVVTMKPKLAPRTEKYIKMARETAVRVVPPLIVVALLMLFWPLISKALQTLIGLRKPIGAVHAAQRRVPEAAHEEPPAAIVGNQVVLDVKRGARPLDELDPRVEHGHLQLRAPRGGK